MVSAKITNNKTTVKSTHKTHLKHTKNTQIKSELTNCALKRYLACKAIYGLGSLIWGVN
jgi:hypothetical protein